MSVPKPGDRVRVSFDAVWSIDANFSGIQGYVKLDGHTEVVPDVATVRVLPPLVLPTAAASVVRDLASGDLWGLGTDDCWRSLDRQSDGWGGDQLWPNGDGFEVVFDAGGQP